MAVSVARLPRNVHAKRSWDWTGSYRESGWDRQLGVESGRYAVQFVSIYANGGELSNLQLNNGQLVGSVLPSPLLTVEAFVASEVSTVLYAGGSPGTVSGLLQVNVRIPSDIQPGLQVPVQLRIGGVFSQPGVTIAIK